jgi:conjugal transfer pilus assembly protein TraU
MKKLLRSLVSIACLVASSLTLASAVPPAVCNGPVFNPITSTDWNNMFPITIAGAVLSTNTNTVAPLMAAMPPVCVCPTILFGMPFVGIGVTYWQPTYVSEIERRPGCLNSLGGVSVLSAYSSLHSELAHGTSGANKATNRMQVHWYEYPLFSMLEMMTSLSCKSTTGFNLAYVTEVDPLWQDDLWGAIFSPESALFSNPVATAACAVDSVASNFDFPMDPLFWCAGSWGTVYPMTGNSQHTGVPFTMNNQIQAKFIARNHRMGLQMQTIGPSAICFSHPNPIWIKSQYRYNQVAPIPRRGRAVVTGSTGLFFQFPPITNVPTQEHTTNLIWQGQQCCLKAIP